MESSCFRRRWWRWTRYGIERAKSAGDFLPCWDDKHYRWPVHPFKTVERFEKMRQAFLGFLVAGVLFQGASDQFFYLLVQIRFFSIPPALVEDRVALSLRSNNVVHLALILKFSCVLPTKFGLGFRDGKFQQNQCIIAHTSNELPFHLLSDQRFFFYSAASRNWRAQGLSGRLKVRYRGICGAQDWFERAKLQAVFQSQLLSDQNIAHRAQEQNGCF